MAAKPDISSLYTAWLCTGLPMFPLLGSVRSPNKPGRLTTPAQEPINQGSSLNLFDGENHHNISQPVGRKGVPKF